MQYKLYELDDYDNVLKVHELEFENIIDIQDCLKILSKNPSAANGMHLAECLPETLEIMEKVSTPITNY